MHKRAFRWILAVTLLSTAAAARGDVTPASPFTDHAVLQQGMQTPVWGSADPGEQVTVSFGDAKQSATADADGKWMVRLADLKASGEGRDLTISGKNTVVLHDVLVGEVWLCSGQSNMDFTLATTPKYYFAGAMNQQEEASNANYPQVRMFSGHWSRQYKPQSSVDGEWKTCTPENVKEFSAIGYFFARDLHKAMNVPVGIITQTYGASTAEAWISREALQANPVTQKWVEEFDALAKDFPEEARKSHVDAMRQWEKEIHTTADGQRGPREPATKDPANNQHNPTVLYNGMIAPIIPYGIKGVLWYQGESIVHGTDTYPLAQEILVKDWRARWNNPNLPFYICQLAAYAKAKPEVREAQATVLAMPHTGMAVTIDIGDEKNVHPKDKQEVGQRLCQIALADAYNKPVESTGPVFQSMKVEGSSAVLSFSHANGLSAKGGGELQEFTIAGEDDKFVPAQAKIQGESVVVSDPDVATPKAVRYAWSPFPKQPNLVNSAGLPAAPFRTDNPLSPGKK